MCQFDANLGEFGVYDLTVDDNVQRFCSLETAKTPVNIYLRKLESMIEIRCKVIGTETDCLEYSF